MHNYMPVKANLMNKHMETQGKKDNPQAMKWKPHPAGFVKANVDAAFNAEKHQGATGVVIRDEHGQIIGAKCKWYASIPNILTAETFAARDGAVLLNSLRWPKAMMETNSLELQSSWITRANNRSTILPVLNESQELIGRCCMSFELIHVKREGNIAAHNLAKFSSMSCSEGIWMYEIPKCFRSCIQHDCNAVV